MSMLNRFRKPGGFHQLLALIEGCEPEKQKNLLSLIGNEDPGWAHLVKLKALSFERIMKWPIEILMEISPHVPEKIQIAALCKMTDPIKEKWFKSIIGLKQKEIRQSCTEAQPLPSEQQAATIKIVQIVRELEEKGLIKLSQIDPSLQLDKRLAA